MNENGFLNLLKPPGMSSAAAVSMVRRRLNGAKVGHAGTLDPEAAGVLPLMIGKATRLFDYMQDKEKAYVTEVAFTGSTDTEDAQGVLVEKAGVCPTEEQLRAILPQFTGAIMQRPPVFSALKQDGTRMYQLARKGIAAELPERPVTVHSLELLGMTENHGALLRVRCSKGFYVRSLCRDLGIALGCPSHMRFLLRIQSGVFTLDTAHTLEELQECDAASLLISGEQALPHIPVTDAPRRLEKLIRNGGVIPWQPFAAAGMPEESPFGIRLNGTLAAIAVRDGTNVKVRTWLGD